MNPDDYREPSPERDFYVDSKRFKKQRLNQELLDLQLPSNPFVNPYSTNPTADWSPYSYPPALGQHEAGKQMAHSGNSKYPHAALFAPHYDPQAAPHHDPQMEPSHRPNYQPLSQPPYNHRFSYTNSLASPAESVHHFSSNHVSPPRPDDPATSSPGQMPNFNELFAKHVVPVSNNAVPQTSMHPQPLIQPMFTASSLEPFLDVKNQPDQFPKSPFGRVPQVLAPRPIPRLQLPHSTSGSTYSVNGPASDPGPAYYQPDTLPPLFRSIHPMSFQRAEDLSGSSLGNIQTPQFSAPQLLPHFSSEQFSLPPLASGDFGSFNSHSSMNDANEDEGIVELSDLRDEYKLNELDPPSDDDANMIKHDLTRTELDFIRTLQTKDFDAVADQIREVVGNRHLSPDSFGRAFPIRAQIINYALRYAAQEGDINLVKLLISAASADPTTRNYEALVRAVVNRHVDIVKELLKPTNNLNPFKYLRPIREVMRANNDELTRFYLGLANEKTEVLSKLGSTLFCVAAESGNRVAVDWFLDNQFFGVGNAKGCAVIGAARGGQVRMLDYLISVRKANASIQNSRAVVEAALFGHVGILERLKQEKSVDLFTNENEAVARAIHSNKPEVIDWYLSQEKYLPIDFNYANYHQAAVSAYSEPLQRLLTWPGLTAKHITNIADNVALHARDDARKMMVFGHPLFDKSSANYLNHLATSDSGIEFFKTALSQFTGKERDLSRILESCIYVKGRVPCATVILERYPFLLDGFIYATALKTNTDPKILELVRRIEVYKVEAIEKEFKEAASKGSISEQDFQSLMRHAVSGSSHVFDKFLELSQNTPLHGRIISEGLSVAISGHNWELVKTMLNSRAIPLTQEDVSLALQTSDSSIISLVLAQKLKLDILQKREHDGPNYRGPPIEGIPSIMQSAAMDSLGQFQHTLRQNDAEVRDAYINQPLLLAAIGAQNTDVVEYLAQKDPRYVSDACVLVATSTGNTKSIVAVQTARLRAEFESLKAKEARNEMMVDGSAYDLMNIMSGAPLEDPNQLGDVSAMLRSAAVQSPEKLADHLNSRTDISSRPELLFEVLLAAVGGRKARTIEYLLEKIGPFDEKRRELLEKAVQIERSNARCVEIVKNYLSSTGASMS